MSIDPSIFKAYDIRGIYPTQLNEENIIPITHAIYLFFKKRLGKEKFSIAVGYDMRLSSPRLFSQMVEVLVSLGVEVIDIGLVPTPTFYFAVFNYHYDAGIQITASHNPKDYNGIKFVVRTPQGLIKIGRSTGMEEVKNLAVQNIPISPATVPGTITKKEHVVDDEVANALAIANNPVLKPFTLVADTANAMGAVYIDALFKKISGTLIPMNFELDGTFPAHQPDPLQADTLVELQKRVVAEHADLGLAPDGDGDRLFFIDEKGNIVPPSFITALVAREILHTNPNATILFDIRYILTPQTIIEENGGKSMITKVGHAFITEELTTSGGIFAGESSGHYFFQKTGNAESQVPMIITVLSVMSREKKPLSEIIEELRRSYESGEINFTVPNASAILTQLKEEFSDGSLSEIDGISISYPTWRFNVRTSNTEPLLRLNVEAKDQSTLQEKKEKLVALLQAHVTNL